MSEHDDTCTYKDEVYNDALHKELAKRLSLIEDKISKISSREKLIHLILASRDFLERKLAFFR